MSTRDSLAVLRSRVGRCAIGGLAGVLLCLACAAPALGAMARWEALASPQFRHYSVDNGLANSALTALAQDRDGFLWIGSQSGLMRFDGYRFRTYQHDPQDAGSIPSNFVQSLFADAAGNLWVGTANAGLTRYDPRTGRFVTYPVGGPRGTRTADVEAIIDDSKGGLWVGTDGGLDHLAVPTGEVTHYDSPRGDSLSHDNVLGLYRESSGSLLVGDRVGLLRFYPDAGRFERLSISDTSGRVVAAGVRTFAEDSDHRLWFGTTVSGVGLFDARGVARLPRLRGAAAAALAGQSVRGFAAGPDGKLFFATYGAGVFVLDPATLGVRQICHSDADATSLAADQAYGLLRDRSGLLWVATEQGLSVTDPGQAAFQTVVVDRTRSDRLTEGSGLAILVDSRERLWVGHHTSGVDVFGADGARVAMLHPNERGARAAGGHSVYAFAESADDTVWLGTDSGLYRVGGQAWQTVAVPFPGEQAGPSIQRLLADGSDLWVGSRTGLHRYDIPSGRWTSYNSRSPGGLSDGFVIAIARRADGMLWVGTRKGLNLFNPASATTTPFAEASPASAALAQAFIVDLSSDPDGRLWVATIDDGVYLLTPEGSGTYLIRHLTEHEGLPSVNIDALQPDLAGGMWISTGNGLAVIDSRSLGVHRYQRADGVRFGDFWAHASALTRQGDLVFGAVGGLTVVRPGLLAERHFEPQLLVSGITVGGRLLRAAPSGSTAGPIVVHPAANSFQVDFAATDYTAPRMLRYAYMLQGYDTDWSVVDATKRTAAYTNLSPGSYLLLVRGTNREGVYSSATLRIPVRVQPAWYQTWWARLLAAAAVFCLVALLVQARTAYLRRVKQRLEALVAKRTEELRRSKQQIEMIAYHDSMTGLPNRRLFAERFEHFRASADRSRSGFTLVLVDLDKFKVINDSLGHAAGDAVLIAAAQRLGAVTREVDVVARLGGDEFAILLDNTVGPEAIGGVCQRILQSFAEAVSAEGRLLQVGISLGCAVYPRDGLTQSDLYRVADRALYEAKAAGRNTWRMYKRVHEREAGPAPQPALTPAG
ncbi:MAG TPA: diguanylate cyclase [Steroidobacteraceae bacterium]|nr:diguanylate cyclase [Steroidobacteraceae bacterium]